MPVAGGGGIFVSYRRQDSEGFTGRLYDRLAERFGAGQVFMDVDAIEPGVDFVEAINRAVAACTVLLAVIGPNWLTATDKRGGRRLDDPGDRVRLEIEAALARDVRVIPVLAQGAIMPGREDLPESLAGLARRNALFIRHESFRTDAGRLVTAIEGVLAAASSTAGPQASGRQRGEEPRQPVYPPPAPHDRQPRILQVGVGPSRVLAVALSPDGAQLATASFAARIWNVQTAAMVRKLRLAVGLVSVQTMAFSPDGTRLATGSDDNTARIWDATNGQQRLQVTHGRVTQRLIGLIAVRAVAFSPDGTRLATGSADNTARIWDATTGEQQLQVTHDSTVWAVAFSPDGTRLATGSLDATARIWDAATGEPQLQVTHDGKVWAVAFSPDGTRLATGSADNTARIWDATTGEQQLQVTHGAVEAVTFSPDGTRLVSCGSIDNTVRVWDATTGEQQFQLTYPGITAHFAFSLDGTRLATCSGKTARIWDITGG
jgi:Tol biopolymer transport system component